MRLLWHAPADDCAATQGGCSTRTGTATRGAATSRCATGPAQTYRPTPPGDTSAGAASAAVGGISTRTFTGRQSNSACADRSSDPTPPGSS